MSQGDLGKDYEHCMELQRKLDDAGSGATRGVDKERIDQIFQACSIMHEMISYILMFRWQPSFAQRPEAKLLQLKPKERKLGANIQLFNRIFRLGLTPPFELLFQFFANRHTEQDLLWLGLCMRSSETRTTPWLGSRRRSFFSTPRIEAKT